MGDNSKFLAGIIVGAAAGAAITLLLNTESGRKVLADLKEAAGKTLRDLQNTAADADEAEDTATAV
jgi:gas vesicle protein